MTTREELNLTFGILLKLNVMILVLETFDFTIILSKTTFIIVKFFNIKLKLTYFVALKQIVWMKNNEMLPFVY